MGDNSQSSEKRRRTRLSSIGKLLMRSKGKDKRKSSKSMNHDGTCQVTIYLEEDEEPGFVLQYDDSTGHTFVGHVDPHSQAQHFLAPQERILRINDTDFRQGDVSLGLTQAATFLTTECTETRKLIIVTDHSEAPVNRFISAISSLIMLKEEEEEDTDSEEENLQIMLDAVRLEDLIRDQQGQQDQILAIHPYVDFGAEAVEDHPPPVHCSSQQKSSPSAKTSLVATAATPRRKRSSSLPIAVVGQTVVSKNWFCGRYSVSEANKRLEGAPNGGFLVRESSSSEGQYVLCVAMDGTVDHIRIKRSQESRVAVSSYLSFSNLSNLIKYYCKHRLSAHYKRLDTCLTIAYGYQELPRGRKSKEGIASSNEQDPFARSDTVDTADESNETLMKGSDESLAISADGDSSLDSCAFGDLESPNADSKMSKVTSKSLVSLRPLEEKDEECDSFNDPMQVVNFPPRVSRNIGYFSRGGGEERERRTGKTIVL